MKARKFVILISGILGSLIIGACIVLYLAAEFGLIPDTKILEGTEISDSIRDIVNSRVPLEADERIMFYYSAGFLSHGEDGNVITNKRIISYSEDDENGLETYSAAWNEITDATVEEEGGGLSDSLILIETTGEDDFYIFLSPEEGRDRRALREIRMRLAATGAIESMEGSGDDP